MAARAWRRVRLALAVTLLLGVGLSACSSDSEDGSGNGAAVGVETFGDRVDRAGVVVLDVRTPAEFAEGHLPDAVNIDVSAGDFTSRTAALDPDATYAVYCRSGNRSAVAVDQLVEAGFTDVQHLDGGIVDWQRSGGTVVTDP